jgi:hypothetical protein
LIRFMWETFPVCYIHQHIDEIYVVYKCNLHLLQRKFVNHLRKHFSEIFQKRSYLIFRTYNIRAFSGQNSNYFLHWERGVWILIVPFIIGFHFFCK